jgi:neuroligin
VRNLFDFHRKEIFDAIVNEYTDWENPHDHPKTIRNGVLDALSDALYTAPLLETARLHAGEDGNKQSNTFVYVFAHETRSWDRGDSATRIRGAITGEDLPYILGYPLWNKRDADDFLYPSQFSSEDSAMSRVMMRYVSNFVKSGSVSN